MHPSPALYHINYNLPGSQTKFDLATIIVGCGDCG